MTAIDALFEGQTELDGHAVEFVLSMTTYDELALYLEGRPKTAERERRWMVSRVFREIAQLGGKEMFLATAEDFIGRPRALADFIAGRNRMHDEARQRGMMFALCPGCKQTEAEISFMYLMLRLRMSPPALTTPDGLWLVAPEIGQHEALVHGARRGDLPLAQQIRFELPSARMGLGARDRPSGGVMAVLDETVEEKAWARFFPFDSPTPSDHAWWYTESVPFRALIRLAGAIAKFDNAKKPSPTTLQNLPSFDIEYLDLAVTAAQFTDEPPDDPLPPGLVPPPRNLPVTCQTCQTQYLPLL